MTSMKVARIERAKARGQYTEPGTKANRNTEVLCQNCRDHKKCPWYPNHGRKFSCEHFMRRI